MSTTLAWRPAPKNDSWIYLSDQLKFILRNRFETQGGEPIIWTSDGLAYLRGLADARIEGAKDLIAAIEEHGRIEVTER